MSIPMKKNPKELGQAGAYLAPGGATGDPDLRTLINDLASPTDALSETVDATWGQAEVDLVKKMVRMVSRYVPAATTAIADESNVDTTYGAAEQTVLNNLKADLNALGFAAISETAAGTYDATTVTLLGNLKTRFNLIFADKITDATPATYTATTQGIISQITCRANARRDIRN